MEALLSTRQWMHSTLTLSADNVGCHFGGTEPPTPIRRRHLTQSMAGLNLTLAFRHFTDY